ncbi:hypothetical protein C1H46_035843 [Malus baccata]|uniref:Uncharacterized protein n=1 Tax=Malus baccata TaxID=106549 RepID=A0A540KWJ1_MALBA|nr:hypothetical protein C1H46_035843 [Malus baccata]
MVVSGCLGGVNRISFSQPEDSGRETAAAVETEPDNSNNRTSRVFRQGEGLDRAPGVFFRRGEGRPPLLALTWLRHCFWLTKTDEIDATKAPTDDHDT